MKGFRVLVADDEPLAREIVAGLLKNDPEIETVVECGTATEIGSAIARTGADIVFLDVEMPEIDGIQVASGFSAEAPVVVFVTAFSDYAARAFDVRAVDYVLKPFSDSRFQEALSRAKERVHEKRARNNGQPPRGAEPSEAMIASDAAGFLQRLTFRDADRLVVLKASELLWIEAQDYYVRLHSMRGRHLLRATLAALESRLDPARFLRVHRGAIVSVDAVREIHDGQAMRLVLANGDGIPVSRSRRRRVASVLSPRLR